MARVKQRVKRGRTTKRGHTDAHLRTGNRFYDFVHNPGLLYDDTEPKCLCYQNCSVYRGPAMFTGCMTKDNSRMIPAGANQTVDSFWSSCEADEIRLKYQQGGCRLALTALKWRHLHYLEPKCSINGSSSSYHVGEEFRDGIFHWLCLETGRWVTGEHLSCWNCYLRLYRLLLPERDQGLGAAENRSGGVQRTNTSHLRPVQGQSGNRSVPRGGAYSPRLTVRTSVKL